MPLSQLDRTRHRPQTHCGPSGLVILNNLLPHTLLQLRSSRSLIRTRRSMNGFELAHRVLQATISLTDRLWSMSLTRIGHLRFRAIHHLVHRCARSPIMHPRSYRQHLPSQTILLQTAERHCQRLLVSR